MDKQTFLIREATAADAASVLAFSKQIAFESDFLSYGPGEYELDEAGEADKLNRFQTAENGVYLLGMAGTDVAGIIFFLGGTRPRTRHTGEMGMAVAKKYWGRGLGSRLIESLLSWGRENPIVTKMNLRTRTDNTGAIGLYTRTGWRVEGIMQNEICIDGVPYDNLWMGLSV